MIKNDATVVIACHDPNRPIRRAVASALRSSGVNVLVIAHNTDPEGMRAALGPLTSRVRVEPFADGIPSPAGPFNHGLAIADTRFVSIMGSDDALETGAVDSWRVLAKRWDADMVLTRLHRGKARRPIHAPAVRPWLHGVADFAKDRLYYRSAPLGLMRRERLEELGLRMTPDFPVGEDIAFSMRLYSSSPVVVQRRGPGYLVGEDAKTRVTTTSRPVDVELQHITDLLSRSWVADWSAEMRAGVAIKTLRIHVFGLLLNREMDFWTAAQRVSLAEIAQSLCDFAPGCERAFSRADTALLQAILNPQSSNEQLLRLAQARSRFFTPAALVPAYAQGWCHREGPLRFDVASFLVR